VLSSVDVAVTIAVPAAAGVNTPEDVIVPSDAAHMTAELYNPVPCAVAVQVDVCVVRIEAGEQTTAIDVIAGVCGAALPPPLPQAVRRSVKLRTGIAHRLEAIRDSLVMGLLSAISGQIRRYSKSANSLQQCDSSSVYASTTCYEDRSQCRSIFGFDLAVQSVAYARNRKLIRKKLRSGAGFIGHTTAESSVGYETFLW
jgi:hypothetical protein